MYSHGVEPGLDFSNLPEVTEVYERMTRMHVYDRQPYSGALVFAAFSGSHQDAIAKGMKWREDKNPAHWNVPYLAIDPNDIGREYDGDVIRINSQSGKGGIAYLMEQKYGLNMPEKMRENFGYAVKSVSDHAHKELMPEEVYAIFMGRYVNKETSIKVEEVHFAQKNGITANVTVNFSGRIINREAIGNGRLDSVSNAVKDALGIEFSIVTYTEHALEVGSKSKAVAYVGIDTASGVFWGSGMHTDIIDASVSALVSAINNSNLVK